MTMNFKYHVIQYVIDIVSLCGKQMIELAKEKKIFPAKDKWELPAVITLMPIVGVNDRLPLLHLSKIMVHIYTTEKTIRQFTIGYMINSSLHINRIFREKIQTFLGCSFSTKTMKTIRDFLLKNSTYDMELIMIYDNSGKVIRKVNRVLIYVVYIIIDNYVRIDYLSCQSKTLCGV